VKGRCALITGSVQGLGLAAAKQFAEAGCHVVLNGFADDEAVASLRAGIERQYGVRTLYSGADLRVPGEIERMISASVEAFGAVDILVNNAVVRHAAPVETFTAERWDEGIAVNLSAAFHTIRLALPLMKKRNWGRIINIASAHGLVASPFKAAYVAAKHGIVGLTKTTALETAEDNITCNAICPGYVYTPLVEAQIEGQAKAHGIPREQVIRDVLLAQQPNKRFAAVEELGALSVFLASDAAASITGAALTVDGGWTAH